MGIKTFREFMDSEVKQLRPVDVAHGIGLRRIDVVAKWYRGEAFPSIDNVRRICKVYGYSWVEMMVYIHLTKMEPEVRDRVMVMGGWTRWRTDGD